MGEHPECTNPISVCKWKSSSEVNWYSQDPIVTRYVKRYLSEAIQTYVEDSFVKAGRLAVGPVDERARHTDRDGAPKLIRYDKYANEINQVWHNEGYRQTVIDGYGTGVVAYRYDADSPERMPFLLMGFSFTFYLKQNLDSLVRLASLSRSLLC